MPNDYWKFQIKDSLSYEYFPFTWRFKLLKREAF